MSNYDKILREKENGRPIANADKEKHWAALEKQLLSSPKTSNDMLKGRLKNLSKPLLGLIIIIIIGILAVKYFKTKQYHKATLSVSQKSNVVKPPLPKLNIPYETFTYNAATGDTLFTQNGSILIFPKDAVLDNNGNVVTGRIEIQTREFNDPLDYCLGGIPMTYDSAGVRYTFISSGMIDIKAYQNGALLLVNPNAKPQLNLVSTNNSKSTNLYVLDTLTGQWINKGKDEVNNIIVNSQKRPTYIYSPLPSPETEMSDKDFELPKQENVKPIEKPLQPQRASGTNPTIKITIDPNSFKELLAYDNLKFEVLNSKTETVGEDSKTEWDNVELLHKQGSKNYIAKFSSGTRSVQYEVKPVLEGKDYDAAVNIYNEKIKAYYDEQKRRISNELSLKDTLAIREKAIQAENQKTEANSDAVIAQNKLIDIENKRVEELNILIIARNKKIDRKIRLLALNENLLRSFTIDNFGYWNCDQATLYRGIPIDATFTDSQNNLLQLTNISSVVTGVNRIMEYYNSNITVLPNSNHALWSVYQNEFFYLTFKEYENLNITTKTRNMTFKLNKYAGANSISELRKVVYEK